MVEGRGTGGTGDETVVERQTGAEGDKKDERGRRREVSEFEKRYSTRVLQMSILQLNKAEEVNEHWAVSVI